MNKLSLLAVAAVVGLVCISVNAQTQSSSSNDASLTNKSTTPVDFSKKIQLVKIDCSAPHIGFYKDADGKIHCLTYYKNQQPSAQ